MHIINTTKQIIIIIRNLEIGKIALKGKPRSFITRYEFAHDYCMLSLEHTANAAVASENAPYDLRLASVDIAEPRREASEEPCSSPLLFLSSTREKKKCSRLPSPARATPEEMPGHTCGFRGKSKDRCTSICYVLHQKRERGTFVRLLSKGSRNLDY